VSDLDVIVVGAGKAARPRCSSADRLAGAQAAGR
jgi:hypothetical protein